MFIYILLALKQIIKKDRVLLELSAQVLKLPIFIQSSTSLEEVLILRNILSRIELLILFSVATNINKMVSISFSKHSKLNF